VFSYTEENVGLLLPNLQSAEALIAGTDYDLNADLQKCAEIRERVRLGPSTGSIVEEAVSKIFLDTIGNKFISTTGIWGSIKCVFKPPLPMQNK
jgi:hypothetical protein